MFITKSIQNFVFFGEGSILECLKKIEKNKYGAIFIVDLSGVIQGIVTDGDIRRWLSSYKKPDLDIAIHTVMNTNYVSCSMEGDRTLISSMFSEGVKIIPILDENGRINSVALNQSRLVEIGDHHIISEDSPCFVIAEIGNNHNGDIRLAKQLVDLAVDSGADCVKFQMRNIKSLYKNQGNSADNSADLGEQYTLDLLSRFQLSDEELFDVFDYCKEMGKIPLCTPWDLDSLSALEGYGMQVYKVASADLTNPELLEAIARTGKTIICSTGMSTEEEIKQSVKLLQNNNAQYILLHCNSTYPTPNRDVNIKYIERLRLIDQGRPVGYSGHERGYVAPVLAVALGAKVIEKHFTIDKNMEGNDHKVSLLPSEFKAMVDQIRLAEVMLGQGGERVISQGEYLNREVLAKSLVINQNLSYGEVITRDMVDIKSPGKGLQPYHLNNLVGKIAQHDFLQGDFFYESDLNEVEIRPREYSFNRPFGIPVRYHDFEDLIIGTNVDFVEFHLSYKDLEVDIDSVFNSKYEIGLKVHSPELFSGDHLLNLCSNDEEYRERSIFELQRVIDVTRKLKKYFPKTDKPLIVTNVGGFSESAFLLKQDKGEMYEKVAQALNHIDSLGVEIVIQTMPPFPWHFGGQSHHNLFVNHNEIEEFCRETGYRICLDVSHSQMACSHYCWSMDDFIKKVSPYIGFLHVVDAVGVDGEGVQIGKGDVDFVQLSENLDILAPESSFIPEVWQGHKQNGSGFWEALEFLEKYF